MNQVVDLGAVAALASVATYAIKLAIDKRRNGKNGKCPYHDGLQSSFDEFKTEMKQGLQEAKEERKEVKQVLLDPEKGVAVQLRSLNQHMQYLLKEERG